LILRTLVLGASVACLLSVLSAPARSEGITPGFFANGGPLDQAAPTPQASADRFARTDDDGFGFAVLLRAAGGFAIVGLLGWGLHAVVKRLRSGGFVASPVFRPLATQAIGPGAFLQVIEIGKRAVVLAVSEKSVVPVTEITDPEELADLRFALERRSTGPKAPFVRQVAEAWRRGGGTETQTESSSTEYRTQ